MKRIFVVVLLLLFSTLAAFAQYPLDGHYVQPYSSPEIALYELSWGYYLPGQTDRVSIVPSRLQQEWAPDRVLYELVYQPVSWENADCLRYAPTSPTSLCESIVTGGSGRKCLGTIWNTRSFATSAEARSFYAALDPLQLKTAYLLATVATNSPFIVVYQNLTVMSVIVP